MTITEETECTTADLENVIGVSARRLQQLAAGGWITGKIGRNRWRFMEATRSYVAHVRECTALGRDPSYN